jgi:hypothetical protein
VDDRRALVDEIQMSAHAQLAHHFTSSAPLVARQRPRELVHVVERRRIDFEQCACKGVAKCSRHSSVCTEQTLKKNRSLGRRQSGVACDTRDAAAAVDDDGGEGRRSKWRMHASCGSVDGRVNQELNDRNGFIGSDGYALALQLSEGYRLWHAVTCANRGPNDDEGRTDVDSAEAEP